MLDDLKKDIERRAQEEVNNKAQANKAGSWKIELKLWKLLKLGSGVMTAVGIYECAVKCEPQ